jgi:hypothetical protein
MDREEITTEKLRMVLSEVEGLIKARLGALRVAWIYCGVTGIMRWR